MTPKEKAIEIYEKFYYQLPSSLMDKVKDCIAQECALISANELIEEAYFTDGYYDRETYWEEIKQEIERL
jgi:hypothetical protein